MKNKEMFRVFGFDRGLLIVTLALLAVGWIWVYSSSSLLAAEKYHFQLHFLLHQVIGSVAGLILIAMLIRVRKPFFQNPYIVYTLLAGTFFLLAVCFVMPPTARVNRWVQFMGIRFQPSELAKISLVLFLAYYLDKKKDSLHEFRTIVFPIGVLAVFVLLVAKEPDFGTAVLIASICAILLFIGGVKARHLAMLSIIGAALFTVYLFQAPYRLERVTSFMSPEKDPLDKGFQVIQSKMAVGAGGLLGVSIGESKQKLSFLPSAHTDFIYAIIGEEFGLLGTLTVLALFLAFLWRGLRIASRAPSFSGQMIAVGLTLVICIQALINISVALGLAPAKGLPLPLISYGRSSLLCNLAAVGILLNISQRKTIAGVAS